MNETAVLLADTVESNNTICISKVLRFFGIGSRVSTLEQFFEDHQAITHGSRKVRLFCSSDGFSRVIEELDRHPESIRLWSGHVHSAFVYAENAGTAFKEIARRCRKDSYTSLIQIDPVRGQWVVSDKVPEYCGVMSSLRIPISENATECTVSEGTAHEARCVLLGDYRSAFFKADYRLVPIFVLAGQNIVDLDAELVSRNFDIRRYFLSATPIVMYVKWAFADICWNTPENNACLIIDDPPLRPQYGFLNYQRLLDLMERHNFTTNIAFIPWNWRRSDPTVVGMFKTHPERYSLSIHGCDHTGGEFGTSQFDKLAWKSRQALDRMTCHQKKTGIHYDRIMIFPQGVFSGPSLAALKQASFTAAVNTEVLSSDVPRVPITISDVWDVAVMKYGSFPIFTRRYPSQGIENFAFDILLGKPCIIVAHHDYCQNECARLIEVIQRLNGLNGHLSWRSLGEVVRRSCRQRDLSLSMIETEMYGSELRLNNPSNQPRRFFIIKRELEASTIKEVRDGSNEVPWKFSNGCIAFEVELGPAKSTTVSILFHNYPGDIRYRESAWYKLKVMLRRYLSEVRDNYVATRWTRPL